MVFLASYFAMALLKVRTFLEHRAHETNMRMHRFDWGTLALGLFVSKQQFSFGPSHASTDALA